MFKSEVIRLKSQIDKSMGLLNNTNFMAKASFDKIELEQKKLNDFQSKLNSVTNKIEYELTILVGEPFVSYFIEELRFNTYSGDLFSDDYFSKVNYKDIKIEEKEEEE